LAQAAFMKLTYGENHIFALDRSGTAESVAAITLSDLKVFYEANFSPSVTSFLFAGDVSKAEVANVLKSLNEKWKTKNVIFPEYKLPKALTESKIYFIDVPGAKQSIINIGNLSLSRTDADYYPAYVMNYKLGGSFNGVVNLVLREEKGFTYGARSGFAGGKIAGPFMASSSVRSSATYESVEIFKNLMQAYGQGIASSDLEFTKNALIRSNALEFETLGALLGILREVNTYKLPFNYIQKQEEIVRTMTLERHKELAQKYVNPNQMYYVIAGDAATQMDALEKLGFGKPILLKE
jgi:zinc protease